MPPHQRLRWCPDCQVYRLWNGNPIADSQGKKEFPPRGGQPPEWKIIFFAYPWLLPDALARQHASKHERVAELDPRLAQRFSKRVALPDVVPSVEVDEADRHAASGTGQPPATPSRCCSTRHWARHLHQ